MSLKTRLSTASRPLTVCSSSGSSTAIRPLNVRFCKVRDRCRSDCLDLFTLWISIISSDFALLFKFPAEFSEKFQFFYPVRISTPCPIPPSLLHHRYVGEFTCSGDCSTCSRPASHSELFLLAQCAKTFVTTFVTFLLCRLFLAIYSRL